MFGRLSSKPKIVFDVNRGVLNIAGQPAQVGDLVGSVVDVDGNVTATVVDGSVITLEEVNGVRMFGWHAGGFVMTDAAALVPFRTTNTAIHFSGAVMSGVQNARVPVALSIGSIPSRSLGLTLRANWANEGFAGDDSYAFLSVTNLGVSTHTGSALAASAYRLGAAGHWHNLVMCGNEDDGIGFFESGVQSPIVPNTLNTVIRGDASTLMFGLSNYDQAAGTFDPGEPFYATTFGIWREMTTAEAQELSVEIAKARPSRRLVCYGDSRGDSFLWNGEFERNNKFGYHFNRRTFPGVSINTGNEDASGNPTPSIGEMIDEDIAAGLTYDAATILTGTNSFATNSAGGGVDIQGPLDALIQRVGDLLESGTAEHVFVLNDVPRTDPTTPTIEAAYLEYRHRLTRHFAGRSRVTVVAVSRSFERFGDPQQWELRYTNDETHWNAEGYRHVMAMLLPIIEEHFGDREGSIHHIRNDQSVRDLLNHDLDAVNARLAIPIQNTATVSEPILFNVSPPLLIEPGIAPAPADFTASEGTVTVSAWNPASGYQIAITPDPEFTGGLVTVSATLFDADVYGEWLVEQTDNTELLEAIEAVASSLAGVFNDADVEAIRDAVIAAVENDLDASDLSVVALVEALRGEIERPNGTLATLNQNVGEGNQSITQSIAALIEVVGAIPTTVGSTPIDFLREIIDGVTFPEGSVGESLQDTFKDGGKQNAQEVDENGDPIPGSFVSAIVSKG